MKVLFCLVFSFIFLSYTSEAIENYLNHPLYPCIQCLCHARTGCWRRQNCASYSISRDYWQKAGGLTSGITGVKSNDGYSNCMRDENCIVGTIISYTQSFGKLDCNCDGSFDCKDRFAIHLFGDQCENPKFTSTYARRFNECAPRVGVKAMLSKEGEGCLAPEIV